MHLRSHCLRKGTLLYHGTSAEDVFEEGGFTPNAPAWFSTSEAVAREFVGWHEGPCPRVLVYRTTRNIPQLARIEDDADMRHLVDTIETATGSREYGVVETAQGLCDNLRQFNGWYIPYNCPEGDDIMLCSTDALEFVERICL